jgi:hypothetical protein
MLEDAAHKAHNKFVAGDWDVSKVSAYLVTFRIAHVAIKAIIDNADQVLNWEYFQQNKENMMEDLQSIEQDVYANPHLYRQWDRPVMWVRGQDLDQTVDTPMHLLFLGLQKTMDGKAKTFMKQRGKHTDFLKYSKGLLEGIQSLNVPWCRCISYGQGGFGGWVSENFLAMCRVSKWFYSRMESMSDDVQEVMLEIPGRQRWTKKNCEMWLRSRGLETAGNAQEVKKSCI